MKTCAVTQQLLVMDNEYSFNAINIQVTEEIVDNFKHLSLFGYNGDESYTTCHRSISPFMAILPATLSQERWHHLTPDQYVRVGSNLTLAKVAQAKMGRDAMPKD
jgi:hypothetical protein